MEKRSSKTWKAAIVIGLMAFGLVWCGKLGGDTWLWAMLGQLGILGVNDNAKDANGAIKKIVEAKSEAIKALADDALANKSSKHKRSGNK